MSRPDVIDTLVGIAPGSALDRIRSHRLQARENAQASYAALFEPAEPGDVSLVDRRALATFVAVLHGADADAAFYGEIIAEASPPAGLVELVLAAGRSGQARGPGGRYPSGALAGENTEAAQWSVPRDVATELGPRLAAAFDHAHMLVFRPREADSAALQRLLDAGWTTTGIVTLSQIVAFLAFQIRVASGLRTLAAHPAA